MIFVAPIFLVNMHESDESGHKAIKIWTEKGSEFHSRSAKSLFQDNNIEMCAVAERFIGTLKDLRFINKWNKIYKYINLISYW